MSILSDVGHLYREMQFRVRAKQTGDHRCLFFVSDSCPGSSAGLRGVQLAETLRQRGWCAEVVPHQLSLTQRKRLIDWLQPNVLVFQKARHPLNRVSHYDDLPIVFDIDDADYLDPKCAQIVQQCAENAVATVAGSGEIAQYLRRYSGDVSTIWTGAKMVSGLPDRLDTTGPPTIVWASSSLNGYQAEADFLMRVLVSLAEKTPFRLVLIGQSSDDWLNRFFAPLRQSGIHCEHLAFMPYSDLIRRVAQFDIGVAPLCPLQNAFSSGKSFGKILVYLNANLAVVASDAVDHALAFGDGGAIVVDSVQQWVDSLEQLLTDPHRRHSLARQGREVMRRHLSITAFADQYEQLLLRVMKPVPTLNSPATQGLVI